MTKVAVDIGGTFTDLVWFDEGTNVLEHVKSVTTLDPSAGLVKALEQSGVPAEQITLFLHATTLVTNLILERKGARVGFLTTKGFRDLLEIQTGLRPNPYDMQWERTQPLVPRHLRAEIDERVDHEGRALVVPTAEEIEKAIERLVASEIEALAVCLINSYANPAHEEMVADVVRRRWPDMYTSVSSEVDQRIREYPRMSTTVANAYTGPVFSRYAADLETQLAVPNGIKFMQSSGGVVGAARAAQAPVNLAYSGPVGGALAGRAVARLLGLKKLITLDMGGTSCDVTVIRDGDAGERDEIFVQWGIPVRVHTVDIHGVGAGGGSIAEIDAGGALTVGPRSAGSEPGPACYGKGGTDATVTDANVVLGLIRPDRFAGGRMPLDEAAARRALQPLADGLDLPLGDLAMGVFRTVNATMAQAIREITVLKGVDPREYTLIAFGGCGPQHALEVAKEIRIETVVIPRLSSVFSALGLLTSDLLSSAARTVMVSVGATSGDYLRDALAELEEATVAALADEAVVREITFRRVAHMRYVGQSHELAVPLPSQLDGTSLYDAFEQEHERAFGTRLGDPAELVDVRVTAVGHVDDLPATVWRGGTDEPAALESAQTAFGEAGLYERGVLGADAELGGPALLEEADTTTYLPPGAYARIDAYGNVVASLTGTPA